MLRDPKRMETVMDSGKTIAWQARDPNATGILANGMRHGFAPLPLITTFPDEPAAPGSAPNAVTGFVEPADAYTGTPDDDVFTGTSGSDTFNLSQGGNDTASGLGGNDAFIMGGALNATDRIDGGTGNDTVTLNGDYTGGNAVVMNATTMVGVETLTAAAGHSYAITTDDATVAAGQRLAINASGLGASETLTFDGSAETDGGFDVTCTTAGSVLTGGNGDDVFTVSQDVTVHAGGGNDLIKADQGVSASAIFDGGAGIDTLDWGQYVSIGMQTTPLTLTGSHTVDIERLHVTFQVADMGGMQVDSPDGVVAAGQTLIVDAGPVGNNEFFFGFDGSAESDGCFVINSSVRSNTISGGQGDDNITCAGTVRPGLGNDTVHCYGTVSFTGGRLNAQDRITATTIWLNGDYSGANAVVFNDTTVTNTRTIGMQAGNNYDLTTANGTVAAGSYMFVSARDLTAANWLRFDGRAETDGRFIVTGGAGNDTLYGGAGDDRFAPGGGDDFVDGGAGTNTADYSTDHAGVTASLAAGTATGTEVGTDTLVNIENLTSGNGNDVLTGNDNVNVFRPGYGNDTVSAGGGDDTINFEFGTLNASDRIDGGVGNDTVILKDYYTGSKALTLNAATMVGVETLVLTPGASYVITTDDATVAAGQTLTVGFAGTGTGSYQGLTFDGSHETDGRFLVTGSNGRDTIIGGAGNDMLSGGAGDDVLEGGRATTCCPVAPGTTCSKGGRAMTR